jgi:hypothetical protein
MQFAVGKKKVVTRGESRAAVAGAATPGSFLDAGWFIMSCVPRAPYKSSPGLVLFDKLTAHAFLSFLFVVLAP